MADTVDTGTSDMVNMGVVHSAHFAWGSVDMDVGMEDIPDMVDMGTCMGKDTVGTVDTVDMVYMECMGMAGTGTVRGSAGTEGWALVNTVRAALVKAAVGTGMVGLAGKVVEVDSGYTGIVCETQEKVMDMAEDCKVETVGPARIYFSLQLHHGIFQSIPVLWSQVSLYLFHPHPIFCGGQILQHCGPFLHHNSPVFFQILYLICSL